MILEELPLQSNMTNATFDVNGPINEVLYFLEKWFTVLLHEHQVFSTLQYLVIWSSKLSLNKGVSSL